MEQRAGFILAWKKGGAQHGGPVPVVRDQPFGIRGGWIARSSTW
jgi:hypothetical protein